jgi:hypothetical protein
MMTIDNQTLSDALLAIVGLIAAIGLVGTVLAFWTMGRAAYRKD